MSKCHTKKYSTDARDKTGHKVQAYAFTCTHHKIFGKLFASKAARDRFATEHLTSNAAER